MLDSRENDLYGGIIKRIRVHLFSKTFNGTDKYLIGSGTRTFDDPHGSRGREGLIAIISTLLINSNEYVIDTDNNEHIITQFNSTQIQWRHSTD